MDKRRDTIVASLTERKLLTDDLSKRIDAVETLTVLEDIYLPFRPKKRTRPIIARERGLEPLADLNRLLGSHGKPRIELEGGANTELFGGVTFLMPLAEARQVLGVSNQLLLKNKPACPGFPDDLFKGGFHRVNFVIHTLDQVACIQLLDAPPAPRLPLRR